MDLVTRASRLPRAGETLIGQSFSTVPGGKGANQAVASARLGFTTPDCPDFMITSEVVQTFCTIYPQDVKPQANR